MIFFFNDHSLLYGRSFCPERNAKKNHARFDFKPLTWNVESFVLCGRMNKKLFDRIVEYAFFEAHLPPTIETLGQFRSDRNSKIKGTSRANSICVSAHTNTPTPIIMSIFLDIPCGIEKVSESILSWRIKRTKKICFYRILFIFTLTNLIIDY